jgi:ParB family chromosome partitioning protein
VENALRDNKNTSRKPNPLIGNAAYEELTDRLNKLFGQRVRLTRKDNGKGSITIPFANDEQLQQIMAQMDKIR